MPTSRHDSLTEEAVNKLSHHLEEMPQNMSKFTSDFRDLYTDQAVGGQSEAAVKFRKIRDDTRQDAMVYLKWVLPATTNFIRSIKEYFENYEALSYEEWCELLPDILEETKTHKDLAQTVFDIHQNIMVPLKNRKDEAKLVMTEFKKVPSVNHDNLSEESTRENMARAIASEKQHEINKNAARTVAETLILALCKFIDGLQEVAQFFQVIENELKSFDRSERGVDERKQSHYKIIKNSAKEIKSSCAAFHRVVPDVRTDLEALPSEDTDQNYVDKWLEKTLADIRSQTTLKALFGTSSVNEKKELVSEGRHSNRAKTSKNRRASTPLDDPVQMSKNKPAQPPKNGPAPVYNPEPIYAEPVQVKTSKNRRVSAPMNEPVQISKNQPAPPPKNRPAPPPKNGPAPVYNPEPIYAEPEQVKTSKNRQASTPLNEPVQIPENKPATPLKKKPAPPEPIYAKPVRAPRNGPPSTPIDDPVQKFKNKAEPPPPRNESTLTSVDDPEPTFKNKAAAPLPPPRNGSVLTPVDASEHLVPASKDPVPKPKKNRTPKLKHNTAPQVDDSARIIYHV